MALSDMQAAIADEISRSDLSTQITREINNAITFYSEKRFWFNENTMVTLTTIAGQRDYVLPPNFGAVLDVRATLGNFKYRVEAVTVQFLDSIDTGINIQASYLDYFTLFNGLIRFYPVPTAGLPIEIKGTVVLPGLTTTAATKAYATNTAYSLGDTVLDTNGNIQKCVTAGTTRSSPSKTYTANTAYSVGDTVLDGNSNLVTCSTAGTSGYVLAVQPTSWARVVGGITQDGTAQWTLTSTQWSTDFNSLTVDGSVVWQMAQNTGNAWTSSAEELIRTRATRMIYQRYIKDMQQAESYKEMEKEALQNLYGKNIGKTALNTVRAHF